MGMPVGVRLPACSVSGAEILLPLSSLSQGERESWRGTNQWGLLRMGSTVRSTASRLLRAAPRTVSTALRAQASTSC